MIWLCPCLQPHPSASGSGSVFHFSEIYIRFLSISVTSAQNEVLPKYLHIFTQIYSSTRTHIQICMHTLTLNLQKCTYMHIDSCVHATNIRILCMHMHTCAHLHVRTHLCMHSFSIVSSNSFYKCSAETF